MNLNFSRLVIAGLLAAVLLPSLGCRAIGRFGESRQSIAARRLSRSGLQAMHEGQWGTAETLFGEALDVSAGDDRAHAGLGETLWQRGEQELAVRHMEEAVRLSGGDPKHVLRLGRMYLENGRLEEAERQSLAALQADRGSAEAWTLRGDCLRAGGHSPDALAAYHRALAIQPGADHAQMQAAEIYLSMGRYDRLLATVDRHQESRAGEQTPARCDMLRGLAMRQLGRPAEAKRCFAKAAAKEPSDASPHLQLASLAIDQEDFATASRSWAKAIELDPRVATAPRGLDAAAVDRVRQTPLWVADQEAGGQTTSGIRR